MRLTSEKLQSLAAVQEYALTCSWSFASYRLPHSDTTHTVIEFSSRPDSFDTIAELEGESGFVVAPFDLNDQHPLVLIRPELVIHGDILPADISTALSQKAEKIDGIHSSRSRKIPGESSREEYIRQVGQIVEMISDSPLEKVVLSRISNEKIPPEFSPSLFFDRLKQAYKDAFVFMVNLPQNGLWFGASPEPLMISKGDYIHTVSLAGTREYQPDSDKLEWGQKEIHEQQVVTEYIRSLILKYGIEDVSISGPYTHRAGKIEHLRTDFVMKNSIPDEVLSFIADLHPTPSLCGLPKERAFRTIKEIENHQREYYTGFLGPFHLFNESHLYVNLRSLKTIGESIFYYQGAGITSDSIPEMEWQETCNKKKTMEFIIQSLKHK
ncbi:MAG: isochorismate synthase [Saprospirales bacterium]|nr:MAG: isochorismate synthase [Saprospirales bacterium]